jgi:DNA recombination protein RmuC
MFIDEFYINSLIGFLIGILLSGISFWFLYRKLQYELAKAIYASRVLEDKLQERDDRLHQQALELTAYKERIYQINQTKDEMRQEFENIAHHILAKSSQTLTAQNQHNLADIIKPFNDHIKAFHDRIENYYSYESKERYSLTKEIMNLQKLNQQISQDAINLTNALKGDNRQQGEWGEIILEKILESSGLKKGREYSVQKSFKNHQNRQLRPDIIIHLPNKREVIIDSKVSLLSYERYYHDNSNKERHLKEFIESIKRHIKSLSEKSYQQIEQINSLDFVLLFIPIEGAFLLAQESDRELFIKAYKKNIILVSPSTLLAVLRVIENAWRFEYQNKNAQLIAKKAGELYEKFNSFTKEMQKVDLSLNRAQEAYSDAYKKLSTGKGNLMHKAQELKALEGIEPSEGS